MSVVPVPWPVDRVCPSHVKLKLAFALRAKLSKWKLHFTAVGDLDAFGPRSAFALRARITLAFGGY
jgi:hypothetical protein